MGFAVKLTIGIIIAVTASLVGYDIWAYLNSTPNDLDTISGRMRKWAFATPIIPWVWCGLAGHFFGPWEAGQLIKTSVSIPILVFMTWTLMIAGLALRSKGIVIPPWTVCVPAFLAGAILWAQ